MNAILDDPEVVVETIAGVLDHNSEVEEIENKLQLVDMIEKDPLSATVVFTDLVLQKQQELDILKGIKDDEEATTPAGHKYEEPPEAVRGQLLRLQKPDSGKGKVKMTDSGRNKVRMRPRPTPSPRPAGAATATTPHPEVEIVTAVQNLIRNGELSQEDVIEEMINQGLLPVDVTDLGCYSVNLNSKHTFTLHSTNHGNGTNTVFGL